MALSNNVVISQCTPGCGGNSQSAAYQNERYGVNTRVFNLDVKRENGACTVCGREKPVK